MKKTLSKEETIGSSYGGVIGEAIIQQSAWATPSGIAHRYAVTSMSHGRKLKSNGTKTVASFVFLKLRCLDDGCDEVKYLPASLGNMPEGVELEKLKF